MYQGRITAPFIVRMGKIILYIAHSIDGQIARKDGSVDWLDNYGNPQDYGMDEFTSKVGSIIWGSKTYEQSLGFGEWMFEPRLISYVLTTRTDLKAINENTFFFKGSAEELSRKIKAESDQDIWLMGGADVITQFQNAGLIDELKLFVIPEVIGDGVPLWKGIVHPSKGTLKATQAYTNGVVELRYDLSSRE
jgi:dihydrofolate reductase